MQTRQASPTGTGARHRGWLTAAPARQPWRLGLRVAGAGLLAAAGAIHLDLYLTGYRSIPVIGWLFLLQVITAYCLAAAVLVTGSRLVAAAGAGFALATLGGYLVSVWIGLFGFKEIRTAAGVAAGVIEVAAFTALTALAAATPAAPRAQAGRWPACRPPPWCCWASRWQQRAARRQLPPAAP